MNNLDKQYQQLLRYILDFGVIKQDRTGIGTKSIFGYQLRHKMSEGFPLITTKKVFWKGVVHELLWFLNGDTNIKYLIDNDINIWNGDAYKNYKTHLEEAGSIPMSLEDFINKIKETPKSSFLEKERTFTDYWGELGPIYGKQWRRWQDWCFYKTPEIQNMYGVYGKGSLWHDQIGVLVHQLRINPDSRRLMVSAWNINELDKMVLPPCHYGFQCYTRELTLEERIDWWFHNCKPNRDVVDNFDNVDTEVKKQYLDASYIPSRTLSLAWNQRSVDTFLGLPFNIASYGLLLNLIAKEVNMIPDELIANLGDTHIYLNHIEQVKEQITKSSFILPKLKINNPSNKFKHQNCLMDYLYEDFELINYISHSSIKAQLNN